MLSVGQFRPEKDHPLQIRAFARFLRAQGQTTKTGGGKGKGTAVKLVLLGSCRGPEDKARVAALQRLVAEEGIEVKGGRWSEARILRLHWFLNAQSIYRPTNRST